MADPTSARFAAAYKKMHAAGKLDPEWFDRARDTLKLADDGNVLLLHALAIGLKEAYAAGRAGRGLPPLKRVQPGSMKGEREAAQAWREDVAEPAPAVVRRTRPAPVAAPTVRQRIVRTPK